MYKSINYHHSHEPSGKREDRKNGVVKKQRAGKGKKRNTLHHIAYLRKQRSRGNP
jgi:hypothetical protein